MIDSATDVEVQYNIPSTAETVLIESQSQAADISVTGFSTCDSQSKASPRKDKESQGVTKSILTDSHNGGESEVLCDTHASQGMHAAGSVFAGSMKDHTVVHQSLL